MRVNENVRIDQTLFTEKCIKFAYYMFVTVTVIKGTTNKDFVILLTRRLHAAITYPAKNSDLTTWDLGRKPATPSPPAVFFNTYVADLQALTSSTSTTTPSLHIPR